MLLSPLDYYTPQHNSGGYYGFALTVRVPVRNVVRPYFRFRTITWLNVNGFSPNLVCALVLWRSGLPRLLMSKFRQFWQSSARDTSVFSFPGDNFCKCRWIFTKLGMCIDIVEVWFGVVTGLISSIFDRVICPWHVRIFFFSDDNCGTYMYHCTHETWYCGDLLWDCYWANFVNFWQLSARDTSVFSFQDNNLSKSQWIFTKLDMCIDNLEI